MAANEDSSSVPLPPGSNFACPDEEVEERDENGVVVVRRRRRIRRSWDTLPAHSKALYVDAVETAIERGIHQTFTSYHADRVSDIQAHNTCAFFLWHRRFLLAYENMLRSLGPERYRCLTVPYWDVAADADVDELDIPDEKNATTAAARTGCEVGSVGCGADSFNARSAIVSDLGGFPANNGYAGGVSRRKYVGRTVEGWLHNSPPVQLVRDDDGRIGIVRLDDAPVPPVAGLEGILRAFERGENAADGADVDESDTTDDAPALSDDQSRLFGPSADPSVEFWRVLQRGLHDAVHDVLGGHMQTTTSTIDPLFFPLHSAIDLIGYVWETCRGGGGVPFGGAGDDNATIAEAKRNGGEDSLSFLRDSERCAFTNEAVEHFFNISSPTLAMDEMYLRRGSEDDVRNNPLIGKYFNDGVGMSFAAVEFVDGFDDHNAYAYGNGYLLSGLTRALGRNGRLRDSCPWGLDDLRTLPDEEEERFASAPPPEWYPTALSSDQRAEVRARWIDEAEIRFGGEAFADDNNDNDNATAVDAGRKARAEEFGDYVLCRLEGLDADTFERWVVDEDDVAFFDRIAPPGKGEWRAAPHDDECGDLVGLWGGMTTTMVPTTTPTTVTVTTPADGPYDSDNGGSGGPINGDFRAPYSWPCAVLILTLLFCRRM